MKLSEVAIFTEDVPTTSTFYERLFGEPKFADDGIAVFDVNGVTVLVHETYDEDADDLPPEDHFAFSVPDLEEALRTVSEDGFTVFREPAEYEWGRSAYVRDPDGRLVELAEQ